MQFEGELNPGKVIGAMGYTPGGIEVIDQSNQPNGRVVNLPRNVLSLSQGVSQWRDMWPVKIAEQKCEQQVDLPV